jgi:hypothetical protein
MISLRDTRGFVPLRGRPGGLVVPANYGQGAEVGVEVEEETFTAVFHRGELNELTNKEGGRRVGAALMDLRDRLCRERGIASSELETADRVNPVERFTDVRNDQVIYRQKVEA